MSPVFKKLFAGSSVEQEAMDAFAAKKKAEAMEEELRNWINLTHGPNAWSDLLKMQVKIRKQRQETLYKQAEIRRATTAARVTRRWVAKILPKLFASFALVCKGMGCAAF